MLTKVLNDFTKDYNQVIYGINPFPPSEIQIKDYIDLWLERLFIENSLDDDE